MKITDLTLTLFKWDIEPWQTGRNRFGGDIQLGVVTVLTDEGIEGHSFLGSPSQGADALAGPLMNRVKPILLGRNPLDIGAIWQEMWGTHRLVSLRAIGAVDVALWDVAGKAAGMPIHLDCSLSNLQSIVNRQSIDHYKFGFDKEQSIWMGTKFVTRNY